MKCPLSSGGSGSSCDSKRVVLDLTRSRVTKSSVRRKKPNTSIQKRTEEESPQEKEKWQAFFDSARDVSTDTETVRELLVRALEEEHSKKEAKENSHTDSGEYPMNKVKGLMTQIYQDLHNVAAAQAFKTGCKEASSGRFFIGEVGDIDSLLQIVSVAVSSAISTSFAIPIWVYNC